MSITTYPVNHPLAVKLWSKKLAVEALKATSWYQFAGKSSDSLIQVFDETSKGAGDRIRVPLRMQLSGGGVGEGAALEGSEESLTTYYDDLLINEMYHAVRVGQMIDQQRVLHDLRTEAKDGLRDWYRDRLDTLTTRVAA